MKLRYFAWVRERTGRSEETVELPDNAHLGYSGDSWRCDSGYEQRGESCHARDES